MVANSRWTKRILVFLFFLVLSFLVVGSASAHKVIIFAWVEGDTVYTESKFSGGKRVQKGDVMVYDLKGNLLLKGKTSEQGEFSFKIPEKTAMKIVLLAGMGHRAEWTVPLEEIQGIASETSETTTNQSTIAKEPDKQTHSVSVTNLSPDDIQLAFEKALDKKLKPVMKKLAESQEHGPTVKDILGGIGYILGLVGVASYFHYRRKTKDLSKP
jgi:nickel transport protein